MRTRIATELALMMIMAIAFTTGCTPSRNQLKNSAERDNRTSYGEDNGRQVERTTFDGSEAGQVQAAPAPASTRTAPAENRDYPVAEYSVREDGDDSSSDYYQTGMASWYGREFNGKPTASGERFDMNEYTAAHKSLPFGTLIEVKNLDNGKTVRVRINDRGPYRGNRIIDLSHAAAVKLGMVSSGEAMVGLTILGRDNAAKGEKKAVVPVSENYNDEGTTTVRAGDGGLYIQAGAFYSRRNAEKMKEKLEPIVGREIMIVEDHDMYKVRISTRGRADADKIKKTLERDDIRTFVVTDAE